MGQQWIESTKIEHPMDVETLFLVSASRFLFASWHFSMDVRFFMFPANLEAAFISLVH